jgi:hypothetical protein
MQLVNHIAMKLRQRVTVADPKYKTYSKLQKKKKVKIVNLSRALFGALITIRLGFRIPAPHLQSFINTVCF